MNARSGIAMRVSRACLPSGVENLLPEIAASGRYKGIVWVGLGSFLLFLGWREEQATAKTAGWERFYDPTRRDKTEMNGAPDLSWWSREDNGNDKG
jgi:hypothetical protein